MANKYGDIINLPHHTSKTRPRMSVYNRAAQFSPFAALTGYDEAVKETARLTKDRIELDEYQILVINDKLNFAIEQKTLNPILSITYFKPDEKKKGGEYITVIGAIKRIDEVNHTVILQDKTIIPINSIFDIEGEIFEFL